MMGQVTARPPLLPSPLHLATLSGISSVKRRTPATHLHSNPRAPCRTAVLHLMLVVLLLVLAPVATRCQRCVRPAVPMDASVQAPTCCHWRGLVLYSTPTTKSFGCNSRSSAWNQAAYQLAWWCCCVTSWQTHANQAVGCVTAAAQHSACSGARCQPPLCPLPG